ncbi:MAG: hypothetical protein GIW95_03695, partial [Candidatus Eremiobacteraeota bacterium]|nr:hypothetical protein [Candidatus Eremiobacteraeota bacterium]
MKNGGARRTGCAALAVAAALLWCGPALAQVTLGNGTTMVQDAFVSDPTGAIAAARKRVNGGDLDGAVKELVRYVSSHPKEIEPARYLADLYYR